MTKRICSPYLLWDRSGYVAGVSNPRFEDLTSTWDVLCNIETGRIHISKDIQQAPVSYTASSYSPSTNASQLSLSTSSAATHSSTNDGRNAGHAPNQSLDMSPDSFSAVSGTLPFSSNGAGVPVQSGDSDIGKAPTREASITSSGGIMGGSTVASSSASFAPSSSTTATAAGKDAAQAVRIEARVDTSDNTFMDEIVAAIQAHFGEAVIRARFVDYMRRFVRLASRYEEETYGTTSIDYPTLAFVPGRLGSGLVFYTNNAEEVKREIQSNAGRIEGWRRTKSYDSYKRDWMQSQLVQSQQLQPSQANNAFIRAIRGVDLHHQISRLRNSKKMSSEEVEHICRMLRDNVKTDEQIIEVSQSLICNGRKARD